MKSVYDFWAKIMLLMTRGQRYVTILNTLMITKVFWDTFDNKTLAIVLLIVGVGGVLLLSIIDYFNVLGKEGGITFEKNTEWILMKEQLDRIEEKVNKNV